MIDRLVYDIAEVRPYINWLYFFHAWGMNGKPQHEKDKLRAEAEAMLDGMASKYHTYAVVGIFDANSDEDDILINGTRVPMLRQQTASDSGCCLCLADFIRPLSSGIKDKIGVFAVTVDSAMEHDYRVDEYSRMLSQTVADRLAEATAEKMHEQVRKTQWGYAADEQLSKDDLLIEKFQGIRPAIGYPSLPDTSVNFIIADLIDVKQINIRLTESGMMIPHASVSGFMFAHPQARYFDLGAIGEDQLHDYAQRRGIPVELMRRFLQSSLIRK